MSISIENALNNIAKLDGFVGTALVDAETGAIFNTKKNPEYPDFDLELSATADAKAMREKVKSIQSLGLGNTLENIQIALTHQYHLICPLPNVNSVFIYCILDRSKADLTKAKELMMGAALQINLQAIQV